MQMISSRETHASASESVLLLLMTFNEFLKGNTLLSSSSSYFLSLSLPFLLSSALLDLSASLSHSRRQRLCSLLEPSPVLSRVIDLLRQRNSPVLDRWRTISTVKSLACRLSFVALGVCVRLERLRVAEVEDETHPNRSLACAVVSALFCPILGK